MAKKDGASAAAATPTTEAPVTAASGNQGVAVILPNGQRRIDFIRDNYYSKEAPYAHTKGAPGQMERGEIKKAINEMLTNAGRPEEVIAFQIVFGATKQKTDPRKTKKEAPAAAPAAATS